MEGSKVGVRSLAHNTSWVEGRAGALWWGLRRMTSKLIIHMVLHKPTTSWLVCNLNIFGAWRNHGQTQTHKIHHGFNLGEATTFPLIIFYVPSHRACTQMSFCLGIRKLGVLKFSKLGLLQLWRPIISCVDLWLKWGLKQRCSPRWELFHGMSHGIYMQVNQGDLWLLMVGSQIGSLTPDPFFGHNLCFMYPNGSCKPILDI
jgi:hypothetical protein